MTRTSILLVAFALLACRERSTESAGGDVDLPDVSRGALREARGKLDDYVAARPSTYEQCGSGERKTEACPRPAWLDEEMKDNINIELLLDASGSMAAMLGGMRKIDAAQDALTQFVGTIPKNANVALRVFGHRGSNTPADRARSCQGTELLSPFVKSNPGQFESAIRSFQPTGWTPLGASLLAASRDFASFPAEQSSNIVYVVSDGLDTCGGDPVAAARELHEASAARVVVNVIGFDVDPQTAAALRRVAEAGGGKYFNASTTDELRRVLGQSIDWTAWTLYRACMETRANIDAGVTSTTASLGSNCLTTRAATEMGAFQTQASLDQEMSEEVRTALMALIQRRHDSIVTAATGARDQKIDAAQGRADSVRRELEKQERARRPQ